jgi:ABC-2 type transport system ATP-binding protein
VLLLDEPTTGLDPRSRIELWEAIGRLGAAGTGVLLTTQYLDEADRLADRIAIIDRGALVAMGTPGRAEGPRRRDVIEVHTRDTDGLAAAAEALGRVAGAEPSVESAARRVAVSVDGGSDRLIDVVRALDERDVAIEDVGLRRPTLDEVFLALTGAPADDHERV